MTTKNLPPTLPPLESETAAMNLRASSWEQRVHVTTALVFALRANGCWLSEQRETSISQMEFRFEMRLSSALDVYSALIAAGLELSHSGHTQMTNLCVLRRHSRRHRVELGSVMHVRLQVSFLEEGDLELGMGAAGLA